MMLPSSKQSGKVSIYMVAAHWRGTGSLVTCDTLSRLPEGLVKFWLQLPR